MNGDRFKRNQKRLLMKDILFMFMKLKTGKKS